MSDEGTLNRREVVATLLTDRKGLLVITGLGSAAYDVMAAGDHDHNYYLWGAMGSAAMIGFGLAMAQPDRPVLVLTGDGEMLMGLGALPTMALKKPCNLTLAVLDNGHYGETGMQLSHTGYGIQLERIAESCGFDSAAEIRDIASVQGLRDRIDACEGLTFVSIKIKANNPPRVLPPRDGVFVKNRFRAALGHATI